MIWNIIAVSMSGMALRRSISPGSGGPDTLNGRPLIYVCPNSNISLSNYRLANFRETRSRKYRSQLSQPNTRRKALNKIYQIYIPLRLLNPVGKPRKSLLRSAPPTSVIQQNFETNFVICIFSDDFHNSTFNFKRSSSTFCNFHRDYC